MPPAVERAREALREGECLLVVRQKAIRIADQCEYGWATVNEYEDELAEQSDNEKHLYRLKCKLATNLMPQKPRIETKKSTSGRNGGPRPSCRLAALQPTMLV